MCKRNKSFIFSYGTKPIELSVKALRGVHELVDFETGDTKHPELLNMMEPEEAELCFLLSFSFIIDDQDEKKRQSQTTAATTDKKDDDAGTGLLAAGGAGAGASGAAPMLAGKEDSVDFDGHKDKKNNNRFWKVKHMYTLYLFLHMLYSEFQQQPPI